MKRKFLEELLHWKEKKYRKPLILKGVRQVGKTYILKIFGEKFFKHVHYINFEKEKKACDLFQENLEPKYLLDQISFYLNASINISEDLLIFDEIQECPRALTSLKYFCEDLPELAVCSAGSLLGLHLNSSSFPVGKVDRLTLYPMCFKEFLLALEDQRSLDFLETINVQTTIPEIIHKHLWNQLKFYFIVGGLPDVVETFRQFKDSSYKATQEVRKRQRDLIEDYFADIAKHSGKVNSMHITRVWKSVPSQLDQTHDGSASRFIFRGVVPGYSRYKQLVGAIDWLEAAGLVMKVFIAQSGNLPFSAYCKENFFKLLMFDVGILGAMAGLLPKTILDYNYGSYKGFFAENFVAQEFKCAGEDGLYSWQENRSEVEFLRQLEGNVVPVEVKSGWVTKAKSLQKFSEKYHPLYRVIMSANSLKIDPKKLVHHYPLYLAGDFPLKLKNGEHITVHAD